MITTSRFPFGNLDTTPRVLHEHQPAPEEHQPRHRGPESPRVAQVDQLHQQEENRQPDRPREFAVVALLHEYVEGDEQEAPETADDAGEAAGDGVGAGVLELEDCVAGEVDEDGEGEEVEWEGSAEPVAFVDEEAERVGVDRREGVADEVADEVGVGGVDVGRGEEGVAVEAGVVEGEGILEGGGVRKWIVVRSKAIERRLTISRTVSFFESKSKPGISVVIVYYMNRLIETGHNAEPFNEPDYG